MLPKVIITGYPRSGTSLLSEVIYRFVHGKNPYDDMITYDHVKDDPNLTAGYNESPEIFTAFEKLFKRKPISENLDNLRQSFLDRDPSVMDGIKSILELIDKRDYLVLKENYFMQFANHINLVEPGWKPLVFCATRNIADVWRSRARHALNPNLSFYEVLEERKEIDELFSISNWSKDAILIDYNYLTNPRTTENALGFIAQELKRPLHFNPDIKRIGNFIKKKKQPLNSRYRDFTGEEVFQFLDGGFSARFTFPFATALCHGRGVDVGCNRPEWALPGAVPVDPVINREYHAKNLPVINLDYIFSSHCLEHIPKWWQVIAYWKDALKANGMIYLYLPHPDRKAWLPWHNEYHDHILHPEDVMQCLLDNGFQRIFVSEKDLNESYTIVAYLDDQTEATT